MLIYRQSHSTGLFSLTSYGIPFLKRESTLLTRLYLTRPNVLPIVAGVS